MTTKRQKGKNKMTTETRNRRDSKVSQCLRGDADTSESQGRETDTNVQETGSAVTEGLWGALAGVPAERHWLTCCAGNW